MEQDLAAARRDVETQTALATKAGAEASQVKKTADAGSADLRKSLQQEHDRATRLAEEVGCRAVTWSARASTLTDVIINCTPVGMHPDVDDTPLPPGAFGRPNLVVFDTIYHPENTMMLKLARERGCKTVTGVDMFLRQAAIQFKLYTGQDAPLDVMGATLKRKLGPLRDE